MNVQFRRLFAILFCKREPVVAIFQVESNEEVIKEFEAERFFHNKEGVIIFQDANSETVGSIVSKPGMSVTKAGHNPAGMQRR
jgi:hypothetical protein